MPLQFEIDNVAPAIFVSPAQDGLIVKNGNKEDFAQFLSILH